MFVFFGFSGSCNQSGDSFFFGCTGQEEAVGQPHYLSQLLEVTGFHHLLTQTVSAISQ